jgi:hypothetical protein
MHPLDGFCIDRVDFLPQVFSGRRDERSCWIDVTRVFENARPDRGKDGLHDLDCPVVERVYGAGCSGFPYTAHDQRLDVARLDLDVDNRPVPDDVERFR